MLWGGHSREPCVGWEGKVQQAWPTHSPKQIHHGSWGKYWSSLPLQGQKGPLVASLADPKGRWALLPLLDEGGDPMLRLLHLKEGTPRGNGLETTLIS